MLSAHFDRSLKVWDTRVASGPTIEADTRHTSPITAIATLGTPPLSPTLMADGFGVVTAARDNMITLVDMRRAETVRTFT